jgi:3-oxoacyl-[acyl-carrier protein] reductase
LAFRVLPSPAPFCTSQEKTFLWPFKAAATVIVPFGTKRGNGIMQELENRVALVTGGSRGIGAAIVAELSRAGANVAFTYRRSEAAAQALVGRVHDMGREAFAVQADSANVAEIRRAIKATVERFGRIDILVNNAGVFPYGEPESFSDEDVASTMAVHAVAPFVAAQAVLKHMPGGGRIISIGSCFAQRVPVPGISLYAMSKSALVGMNRALARDLGARGITVNVVHPGPTDTDMNPADGETADAERALTAVGRYAEPAEVAKAVVFLASDAGACITGTELAVDGGYAA